MPAPATITDLLDLGQKSGILDRKTIDTYLAAHRGAGDLPEAPRSLADALVRDGLLTRFQAEQLLRGKWRNFTINGKYRLLERIGVGGMGVVYLCEHLFLKRRVALKVLPAGQANNPGALERFHREGRAVAALDHPNIVKVHDLGQEGKLHFLVMEYVAGSSLHEIVRDHGVMEVIRAAHYIAQAASGLQHAHEAGLVHRDIKPGNLLLDRAGRVKVLDLGLARFFHDDQDHITQEHDSQAVLGTADYLAPEQALDSHAVDIRADVYSLGVTFYFLLTGTTPHAEGTLAQKLIWHQVREPKPVRTLRPEVPPELAAVVEKMMAKDTEDRYQTPAEVVQALEPWTQVSIELPPEEWMPRLSRAAGPPSGGSRTHVPQRAPDGPRTPVPEPLTARTPPRGIACDPTPLPESLKPGIDTRPPVPAPATGAVLKPKDEPGRIVRRPERRWLLVGGVAALLCTLGAAAVAWKAAAGPSRPRSVSPAAVASQPTAVVPSAPVPPPLIHRLGLVRTLEGHTEPIGRLVVAPDGRHALSGARDHSVRLWDLATGRQLRQFDGHTDRVHFVAYRPDGRRALSCGRDATIRIWDVDKGTALRTLRGHEGLVWSAVFTPDGRQIFSGAEDRSARLWDAETGELVRTIEGHTKPINWVGVSPDGQLGLTAAWDGSVRLWRLATGAEVRRVSPHGDRVNVAVFSPDGKHVLSAGSDKVLRLWETATGRTVRTFDGHTQSAYALDFSRDGRRIVSAGADKVVIVWGTASGRPIERFEKHTAPVVGVAFTPDGRFVLSGSHDKTLCLWGLPPTEEQPEGH